MGILDDPTARILRLFELEEYEGHGADCQRFTEGTRPSGVPLDEDERVHGIYKGRFYFTPRAFIQRRNDSFERIRWQDVRSCSSQHGQSSQTATLVLVDGSVTRVPVGEFATGWSGRISQLFFQLIEKHGAFASCGVSLCTIDEFFAEVSDPYDFLPNLEPHPTIDEAREFLRRIERHAGVRRVLLHVSALEGESPVADGLVVCGTISAGQLADLVEEYGPDGVCEADVAIRGKVKGPEDREHIWHVLWD